MRGAESARAYVSISGVDYLKPLNESMRGNWLLDYRGLGVSLYALRGNVFF